MKLLLRFIMLLIVATFTYEFCMNTSVILWARGAYRLKITIMAATGWSSTQIGGSSSQASTIRLILSRPRMWYPTFINYVPQLLADSNGVAFGFGGDAVVGGGGVLGGGGLWMLFPYGGISLLTPYETSKITKWEYIPHTSNSGELLSGS